MSNTIDRSGSPVAASRRRQRRKEARPAELLAAGFVEFADKGFLATRLEDVAERAGVAKGTIYLYFPSKEALFEAAVRARILPLVGELGELVDGFAGSTQDLLRLVLAAAYRRIADPDARTLLRIMIAEGHRFPRLVEFYHREFLSKVQALLARVLERGVARGEFNESAATRIPVVLMAPAIVAGIWQMTFAALDPIPLERFMEAHLALLIEGLSATGKPGLRPTSGAGEAP